MKTAILALAVLLSGCATITPAQKKAALVVGSFVAVGLVASHGSSHGQQPGIALTMPPGPPCTPQPNGTCR